MTKHSLHLGKNFEKSVLFSLGVVTSGRLLHTAGITARDADGTVVGKGDMRAQVAQCFANLDDIIEAAGGTWEGVVKYTIYTTRIKEFNENTLDIRSAYFSGRPAATLIEVSKLIDPDMLVEIEAVVALDE